jgi:hypothetical protein
LVAYQSLVDPQILCRKRPAASIRSAAASGPVLASAGAMNVKWILPLLLVLSAGCAPALVPAAARAPGHPGFDTWRYPGDDLMRAWYGTSPYQWVGYYLQSPCHRSDSWMGRRETLSRMGWGIALLYVGQQVFEGQTPAEITQTTVCSPLLLTEERGRMDGRDAVAKAQQEGFPTGSLIYLDVERMERIPPAMVEYFEGWLRTVLADGRFTPAVYAHRINAAGLYAIAQRIFLEAGRTDSVSFWVAGGTGFSLDLPPQAVGLPFAQIWQGVLDTNRTWAGRTVNIDENVATRRSPSDPPSPIR